jgi:hypothetical protein
MILGERRDRLRLLRLPEVSSAFSFEYWLRVVSFQAGVCTEVKMRERFEVISGKSLPLAREPRFQKERSSVRVVAASMLRGTDDRSLPSEPSSVPHSAQASLVCSSPLATEAHELFTEKTNPNGRGQRLIGLERDIPVPPPAQLQGQGNSDVARSKPKGSR